MSNGGGLRLKWAIHVSSSNQVSGDIMEDRAGRMSQLVTKKWQLMVGTGEYEAVFGDESHPKVACPSTHACSTTLIKLRSMHACMHTQAHTLAHTHVLIH